MRIGIITFHHAHNSGAMLQTLALQTYLQNAGHEVSVINYRVSRIDRSYTASPSVRKKNFECFMQKHLNLSPLYRSLDALQRADHPYDAVIAGSDQIWNEVLLGGLNPAYFCVFGKDSLRRIIYGASLGQDSMSHSCRLLMQRFLQYPDFISVREDSMIRLLQPLTEKPLTTVLDPSLLLSEGFYHTLAAPVQNTSPYIYLHYVHHSGENPLLDRAASELSEASGLPILKNRPGLRFRHELTDCSNDGPAEFLGRIRCADYVISDSFHANVFSILFFKRFLTVLPVKRQERLLALLSSLQLSPHRYREQTSIQNYMTLPDYRSALLPRLDLLRQSSAMFLRHALQGKRPDYPVSYFTAQNPFLCYGCAACHALHPEQITGLQEDSEAFLYPQTTAPVSKKPLCIYQTGSFAPATNTQLLFHTKPPEIYLGHHMSPYERALSYEGGLLPAFFRYILSQNGAIIGRYFDSVLQKERYAIACTEDDCRPFLAFRPQEAPATELLQLIRSFSPARPLLVLATPCHLAAVRKTFADRIDSLILLEHYCSGVFSSVPLQTRFHRLQNLSGQTITDYNLAAKHFIPSGMRVEYIKKDGSLFTEYRSHSRLFKSYYAHTLQRPSCYACTFRANFPCIGDLAIATVSPKQKELPLPDTKHISCLQILTAQGKVLSDACKAEFCLYVPTDDDMAQLFPSSAYAQFPLTAERANNYISPSNVVTAGPVI